jgi:hypothetical protein
MSRQERPGRGHSEASSTHGICPACLDALYPDLSPLQ